MHFYKWLVVCMFADVVLADPIVDPPDDVPAADAIAAGPVVRGGRGRARGRGHGVVGGRGRRGRTSGFQHTSETKLKMQLSHARRRNDSIIASTAQIIQTDAQRIVTDMLGQLSATAAKKSVIQITTGDTVVVDRYRSARRDNSRLLVSHVTSQALGIKRFMEEAPGDYVNITNQFDDASMWVGPRLKLA